MDKCRRGRTVMILPMMVRKFSLNSSKLRDVFVFYFPRFPCPEIMLLTHVAEARGCACVLALLRSVAIWWSSLKNANCNPGFTWAAWLAPVLHGAWAAGNPGRAEAPSLTPGFTMPFQWWVHVFTGDSPASKSSQNYMYIIFKQTFINALKAKIISRGCNVRNQMQTVLLNQHLDASGECIQIRCKTFIL